MENIYITKVQINSVRHLKNIVIPLSKIKKKSDYYWEKW